MIAQPALRAGIAAIAAVQSLAGASAAFAFAPLSTDVRPLLSAAAADIASYGPGAWILIVLLGASVTYFWRWLGVLMAARIDPEGLALRWVRAVATALVAALVARMVLFPSGLLEQAPAQARIGGLIAGAAFWFFAGRRLAAAIGVAVLVFFALEYLA